MNDLAYFTRQTADCKKFPPASYQQQSSQVVVETLCFHRPPGSLCESWLCDAAGGVMRRYVELAAATLLALLSTPGFRDSHCHPPGRRAGVVVPVFTM